MAADTTDQNRLPAPSAFALLEVEDEAILFHPDTGAFHRLNGSAREIWSATLAGRSVASVADGLVARFGLPRDRAERDVREVLMGSTIQSSSVSPVQENGYLWREVSGGYEYLLDHQARLCAIDARGDFLRLAQGLRPSPAQAFDYLKTILPKLLTVRGVPVLHASAIERNGEALLVFSGQSGAGKTTSARAFAHAGARLVSEDLLLLAIDESGAPHGRVSALITGEAHARGWVSEGARQLARTPDLALDCRPLDRCQSGERREIGEIWLLSADRRRGEAIETAALATIDAVVALIDCMFLASREIGAFRLHIDRLRRLVAATSIAEATLPLGLDSLRAAAASSARSTR